MASEKILSEETVEIIPDASLFWKLGRSNFTLAYALGEFIDNAYDARGDVSPVIVEIELNEKAKRITIADNACGMSKDQLRRALIVAAPSGKSPDAIGEFGIGLKAAAMFLADSLTIETTPVGGDMTYRVSHDGRTLQEWKTKIQSLTRTGNCGTRIILDAVVAEMGSRKIWGRGGKRSYKGAADELAEVYHRLIDSGRLKVIIDGKPLEAPLRTVKPDARWEIDLEVNGKRVIGWVGATQTWREGGLRHYTPGFYLIRRDRVVKKGEWIGIKYHSSVRAMIGELELDQFPVNNNKTDFLRDTKDWAELTHVLEEFLKDQGIRQSIYKASETRKKEDKGNGQEDDEKGSEGHDDIEADDNETGAEQDEESSGSDDEPQQEEGDSADQEAEDQSLASDETKSTSGSQETPQVFIVHGQDSKALEQCMEVVSELGLEPIALEDKPGVGIVALLAKFEKSARQSSYAVVLLTPDDVGWSPAKGETFEDRKPRARQNVVFEFGYFVKWSKKKTVCLYKSKAGIDLPTDILGIHYLPYSQDVHEIKEQLRKEMVGAGVLAE